MTLLNQESFKIPFVERENEIHGCLDFLKLDDNKIMKKELLVIGKSGTGKSKLVEELFSHLTKESLFSEFSHIHIDTFEKTNDNYSENLFFEILIYNCWKASPYTKTGITKIDKKNTFEYFIKKKKIGKNIKASIYGLLRNSLEFIPNVGSNLKMLFPDKLNIEPISKSLELNFSLVFQEYLEYLSIKKGVLFVIDNIQFLKLGDQNRLRNILNTISGSIVFIPIVRTKENDKTIQIVNSLKYYDDFMVQLLNPFSEQQTISLIQSVFTKSDKNPIDIGKECYQLTSGNLKEIEQFIFRKKIGKDQITLPINYSQVESNIVSLPKIKRSILVLASLFPTGIKKSYINDIIKEIFSSGNFELSNHFEFLEKFQLIKIEKDMDNIIKPSHEKVANSASSFVLDEEFIEIRNAIIKVFKEKARNTNNFSNFSFLINSLIGLQKISEMKKITLLISKYIQALYENCQFNTILLLYDNITTDDDGKFDPDILKYFPLIVIKNFLDSFQKTSDFNKGLKLITSVKEYFQSDIFEGRYLLQLYNYVEAEKILSRNLENLQYKVAYLNLKQHLRKDSYVRREVSKMINSNQVEKNDAYYVILRNTGYLFKSEQANINLRQCVNYFSQKGDLFGKATSLNNLGINYLINKDIPIAEKYFIQAKDIMKSLYSNEIYQSTFNLGICSLFKNNFLDSIKHFSESRQYVPVTLEYDKIKINFIKCVAELLQGKSTLKYTLILLENFIKRAKNLPDPWILFIVRWNYGSLNTLIDKKKGEEIKKVSTENYKGKKGAFSMSHTFSYCGKRVRMLIPFSIHWRY